MLIPKLIPSAMTFMANRKVRLAILLVASTLAVSSCAALQPPSATGPRGNDPLYPILLNEDSHRREAIAAALKRLAQPSGNSATTDAQLQPVTATILSLPSKANGSLYLPKVGATAVMNEEETRESLRRFIKEWQELIGADPAKLSLVEPSINRMARNSQTTNSVPFAIRSAETTASYRFILRRPPRSQSHQHLHTGCRPNSKRSFSSWPPSQS